MLALSPGGSILEIGAGSLRNSLHLQSRGFNVHVLEVTNIDKMFPDEYRLFSRRGGVLRNTFPVNHEYEFVLCTFVIETICRPAQRRLILCQARRSLKRTGALIISTRGPADVVTAGASGRKCSDGYLTPNLTFARSFTRAQLARLLKNTGFRSVLFLHKPATKMPKLLHAIAWKVSQ